MKSKKIPITRQNQIFAIAELDFTHDYSNVKIGSFMINRYGDAFEVTNIYKDECGRRQFWSNSRCLTIEYKSPHNMLTKQPFYAYEYRIESTELIG